ncbi:MAG: exo-beta-N-acetylmuramidase NamZ domain-containing protein [Candidatus Binatus sp.]|uniref:exo-beta-N-acetylmuramidase NamZ domain-containing protein n=1 Tax=Candidatus Binatus sp. TaxID=2811406 RepID=UPI003C716D3C
MRSLTASFSHRLIAAAAFQLLAAVLATSASADAASSTRLREADLQQIDTIVQSEIEAGRIHGAVVEIGQGNQVVYRHAFGYRALEPRRVAMTPDTIFDLASLTKPVATTVAIMQLRERGRIDLDAPVATYWPAFARNGKERITIRQLMTHYSGLAPDLDLRRKWTGYSTAMKMTADAKPLHPPGTHYEYSDINFEALGEVVRRVARLPLNDYCRINIFTPLGMADTGFSPPARELSRIAPTEYVDGKLRIGEVHDPTAARMGGLAGHAGLFSTADDLAIFARMMLAGGHAGAVKILSARSIDEMTIPQSPVDAVDASRLRGLGWDLGAPLCANREQLLPVGSYGHFGFTGTMLWIDPVSSTYAIILTNRTYPSGAGDAGPLRREILTLMSDRLGTLSEDRIVECRRCLNSFCALAKRTFAHTTVLSGADVLAGDGFAQLKGTRVGLITNQTGVTQAGTGDIEALSHARGLTLRAIFSPEHGLHGDVDETVAPGAEPVTGLQFFSLYGETRRPSATMLDGLDAVVFDVQDSGARFYTYVTTMAYAMEEAGRRGIDFYVLDRPNPISCAVVQGPIMDADLKSFTGYFPLPTRHGMTVGELAEMFNGENHIGARLHVIKMRGYARSQWFDQTGLRWTPPSPNLRTLAETTLYPGVAMIEGANVSVGRGTDTPFELVGAPWIDSAALLSYLDKRRIPGVRFQAADFTPSADSYAGRSCHGVRISLDDRLALDSPALGIELIAALHRLYTNDFKIDATLSMVGSRRTLEEIKSGVDPKQIVADWQPDLEKFRILRARYLLY